MGDQKSTRGSFPAKLYELVEGHSASATSDEDLIVSWCEGGLAFIVRDLTRFCEEVLPQHFCHNKWASFIRQLNLYGFRRITQGQSSGAYWHKYFQRGQPQLLRGITRSRNRGAAFDQGDEHEEQPGFGGPALTAPTPGGFGDKLKKQIIQRPASRGFTATAPWSSTAGAVAPMHSGVPLPQMPPLASLAQLPPPPIISDEALLKELDSLVQQQKAQHEKLATPSPASSSNSLQRVQTNTKISAAGLRNAPPVTLPSSSRKPLSSSSSHDAADAPAPSETMPPPNIDNRKRIASHQSVHSVGSVGGEMTDVGGHPPTHKRFDTTRTMSKSSLASDDWDLNIADVDSLNLDDWRWSEANQSGARGALNTSLNTSLDRSSASLLPSHPAPPLA